MLTNICEEKMKESEGSRETEKKERKRNKTERKGQTLWRDVLEQLTRTEEVPESQM